MNRKTVIIVGGGFAGRRACRALRRMDTNVLLFDPRSTTVMLPALPDLAGGWIHERLLFQPLEKLIPKNVQHVRRAVSCIDPDKKTVTADGAEYSYDYLLIAAGSVASFHGFDQHREQIFQLDSLESALRIRDGFPTYLAQTEHPHLVIAGGGYTGLELAASLFFRAKAAGRPCRATIVNSGKALLPFLPEQKRARIETFLSQTGVEVIHESRVTGFDGQNVTAGDHVFENAFLCWAGGSMFAVPELRSSAARLRDGRIRVSPDLSLPGAPNVFAAGDSCAFEQHGQVLRKAVNFAWYEGFRAGKNIARQLRGQKPLPFRPVDLGWVIPLHAESVGQIFGRLWIRGNPGLRLHYLMCGFRNYSLSNFAGFARIALNLFRKETSHED